jgi:hypothetical protein
VNPTPGRSVAERWVQEIADEREEHRDMNMFRMK